MTRFVQAGEVRVRFKRDPSDDVGKFMLEVEDDGCGLTDDGPKGTGLGSKLISAMAHSLSSSMTYDKAHRGCRAVLVAPL